MPRRPRPLGPGLASNVAALAPELNASRGYALPEFYRALLRQPVEQRAVGWKNDPPLAEVCGQLRVALNKCVQRDLLRLVRRGEGGVCNLWSRGPAAAAAALPRADAAAAGEAGAGGGDAEMRSPAPPDATRLRP